MGYVIVYLIIILIVGSVWGFATKAIINNKGYNENWFWWGFFFGFIALIVAISKPENRNRDVDYTHSHLSAWAEEKDNSRANASSGWKCSRCGLVNANYTGTCSCGMSKSGSAVAAVAKAKGDKELQNLQKLKSYKDLLDSGVITQEDFDKKKGELLV